MSSNIAIKDRNRKNINASKTLICPAAIGRSFVLATFESIFLSKISFITHPSERTTMLPIIIIKRFLAKSWPCVVANRVANAGQKINQIPIGLSSLASLKNPFRILFN